MKAHLQVMKFGGTSVGDAACIARTAQIIAKVANENRCVAVVSAMSGVTNRLIEAAKKAQAGDAGEATAMLDALRQQHETALTSLVQREDKRARIRQRMDASAKERRCCTNLRRAPSMQSRAWENAFPRRWWRQPSESWGCQAKRSKRRS